MRIRVAERGDAFIFVPGFHPIKALRMRRSAQRILAAMERDPEVAEEVIRIFQERGQLEARGEAHAAEQGELEGRARVGAPTGGGTGRIAGEESDSGGEPPGKGARRGG